MRWDSRWAIETGGSARRQVAERFERKARRSDRRPELIERGQAGSLSRGSDPHGLWKRGLTARGGAEAWARRELARRGGGCGGNSCLGLPTWAAAARLATAFLAAPANSGVCLSLGVDRARDGRCVRFAVAQKCQHERHRQREAAGVMGVPVLRTRGTHAEDAPVAGSGWNRASSILWGCPMIEARSRRVKDVAVIAAHAPAMECAAMVKKLSRVSVRVLRIQAASRAIAAITRPDDSPSHSPVRPRPASNARP